ncbi:virulence factor Mce family protein [Mycolicibacterium rhodesiae JS60]|nr:virulence factor Mce family protein [Mycolicibacterium rhodesiae JS60]
MRMSRTVKLLVGLALTVALVGGSVLVLKSLQRANQTRITAYFENTNGVYVGDDVMILGVRVGKIETIEPRPKDAKVTFTVDTSYKVPANVNAVVISPTLVTARAIQLTPAYTSGPAMSSGGVIPLERTAVPVEYDDLRDQLQKLTDALQPTQPGGVSTLGSFINTAADNVRGQGAQIREALLQMSQTFSALGDHSDDLFGTVKSLSTLVKGLQSSTDLMSQLNISLASVTGLLANDPSEVDRAIGDLNAVVTEATTFVSQHREALGTASDKITSISQALADSIDDIKQTLHITPTAFSNFINIYEPASASITGALSFANFANPISFICGAIQAASRLNNEQSAKLCVQYLAPIVKNRQWNFPPIGGSPMVGAQARPNEVTFSEDWLRPLSEAGRVRDFYEGVYPPAPAPAAAPTVVAPLPAEAAPAATNTDPAAGLPGMMVPQESGS